MHGGQQRVDKNWGWLVLAGVGGAAALYAAWAAGKARRRGTVGAHAWLVPTQAWQEARWTRRALVHASESKG
jgi:hypothetical protein